MKELLTPGVYFEEAQATPGIASLRTDVAFFEGISERGPVGSPVRVTRWEQFRARYGEFLRCGYLAYCVKGFFESGGEVCWITRVAAAERTTQTVGAQPLDRRSSNVVSPTGLVAGAVATLIQVRQTLTTGVQPADRLSSFVNDVSGFPQRSLVEFQQAGIHSFRHVKSRDASTNRLDWDAPLDAAFNLALPITLQVTHSTRQRIFKSAGLAIFWEGVIGAEYNLAAPIEIRTGAAKASLALLDATSHATLRVSAIDEGSWGNRLTVHVGRSSRFAARTSAELQPAGSVGLLLENVVGFRRNQLIRIFQPGSGPSEYRVLDRVDVARRSVSWTGALPIIFDLTDAASAARPISVESVEFTLSVALDGLLSEIHEDLSLVEADKQFYAPAAVARVSRLLSVEVISSVASLQDRLPDPDAVNLSGATGRLSGGREGIAALSPAEFLQALDGAGDVDEIAILSAPDLMISAMPPIAFDPQPVPEPDPCALGPSPFPDAPPPEPLLPEQAPSFTLDQIERIQQTMLTQCERKMDRFAILDAPPFPGTTSFAQIQSWRRRFDSKYGALYYPWILTPDPLRVEKRPVRRIPPSGGVAGVYAANDLELGVHHAPANRIVKFAQGAAEPVSDGQQDILNPMGVNCLRDFSGRGLRVWGARTVSSDSSWRYVNVRRLMSFIEEALEEGLAWAVFLPNNIPLRNMINASVTIFLESLWERGALIGTTADEAFFVRCDAENNPPALAAEGKLLIEIGVAPAKPAEFVVIRLGRLEDSFEIEEKQGHGYGNG